MVWVVGLGKDMVEGATKMYTPWGKGITVGASGKTSDDQGDKQPAERKDE